MTAKEIIIQAVEALLANTTFSEATKRSAFFF